MVKGIIFDFFGVICGEVAPTWIRSRIPNEDPAMLHEKFIKTVDLGVAPNNVLFETLGRMANIPPDQVQSEWQQLASLRPEVVSLIKELKINHKIGLCSNAWSSFIRPILNEHNLVELFDAIVISSEVHIIKPDPKIFELITDMLNTKPDECVFIDDREKNIEGARAFGIKSILYTSTDKLKEDLGSFL